MKASTNLPEKLKELRIRNNYSQTYVAEYLNITRQAVSRWETGNATPDLDNLLLLAKLYNTSIDDILGSNNENIPSKEMVSATSNASITPALEMIGLSIILVLSMLFPFVPILISAFVAFWLKTNERKYLFLYVLCVICLIIGIYNTYVFFMHVLPSAEIYTITPV